MQLYSEIPEADDALAFILRRIRLMWALTDYQNVYDYHVMKTWSAEH